MGEVVGFNLLSCFAKHSGLTLLARKTIPKNFLIQFVEMARMLGNQKKNCQSQAPYVQKEELPFDAATIKACSD